MTSQAITYLKLSDCQMNKPAIGKCVLTVVKTSHSIIEIPCKLNVEHTLTNLQKKKKKQEISSGLNYLWNGVSNQDQMVTL